MWVNPETVVGSSKLFNMYIVFLAYWLQCVKGCGTNLEFNFTNWQLKGSNFILKFVLLLKELMSYLEKNPAVYKKVLVRKKQEEAENAGIFSYMKVSAGMRNLRVVWIQTFWVSLMKPGPNIRLCLP